MRRPFFALLTHPRPCVKPSPLTRAYRTRKSRMPVIPRIIPTASTPAASSGHHDQRLRRSESFTRQRDNPSGTLLSAVAAFRDIEARPSPSDEGSTSKGGESHLLRYKVTAHACAEAEDAPLEEIDTLKTDEAKPHRRRSLPPLRAGPS